MSHFGRSGPPDITDTYSLLVLNITFRTTADDLFPFFDKYGKVVDIFIPRDRRTGDSRGFAFVRYKYADEAQKAVERLDVGTEMTRTGKRTTGKEVGAGVWTDMNVRDITAARTEATINEAAGVAVSVLIMLEEGEEAAMMMIVEVPAGQSVDHRVGLAPVLAGVFPHSRPLQRMKAQTDASELPVLQVHHRKIAPLYLVVPLHEIRILRNDHVVWNGRMGYCCFFLGVQNFEWSCSGLILRSRLVGLVFFL
ncbi:unnamed protein product [Linum tenue]|uniref:RRM domain-containing protein n=1 Tax=Linum tenue TaxID=586396 RepID=A0AAV0IY53_9ROSI|nr:unnamed protein product [Linum tenue]